ncbi:MAG: hypothetical protein KBT27_06010 [Prevotellaceae bacterium]|nr:hypothetical protein [Candidatus Faecinaster equi]
MSYKIHTKDANSLIETIFTCVQKGEDPKGKEIKTWSIKEASGGIKRLVHTKENWAEIGNIGLSSNEENDIIVAKFRYWESYEEDNRSGDEGKYYLGRFTELMLVHFEGLYSKIEIV